MLKILVVEDEKKLNQILQDYLMHYNNAVSSALSGQEALNILDNEMPDLILLDLNLPDIDGLDVLREVRNKCQGPVIIVSARIEEVDRLIGLELGAEDYII